MNFYLFTFSLLVLISSSSINAAWNDATNEQFHIQTDEGPERYFRYQTHNGQYRKEKRLEDGTVIGSYGWIDSNGYLRLRDYIADDAGYRILRTKNVFVGRNRPISQAIKTAKKVAGSSSVYLPPSSTPKYNLQPIIVAEQEENFVSTTPRPFNPYDSNNLIVDISHNSYISSTTSAPSIIPDISNAILPSSHSSTPVAATAARLEYNFPSSTPHTVVVISPKTSSLNGGPSLSPLVLQHHHNQYASSTISPPPFNPISSNSLLEYYAEDESQLNPYIHRNGPTYPIDRHGNTYFGGGRNSIQPSPETKKYANYDGVSVTNDGFRYYLPRAYHEEQSASSSSSAAVNGGDDKKVGSFGYIDPFGIRRVVYYNAGRDGFQHRKNNRYVGFDATPYDPRPLRK